MITIQHLPDGGAEVQLDTRQPLVYLDQWALYKFANQESLRARLMRVFETKGTLMFSWMNIAEIATLQGDSRRKIEELLAGIGVHWFPIDVNVEEVMEREDNGQKLDAPFDAVLVEKYYPFIHGDEVLSLSKVVRLTDDAIDENKALLESHKTTLLEFVAEKRAAVQRQPELARTFATVPFDAARPSRHVYLEIFRPIISDPSLNLSKNDAVDVFHTVVASAYCDVVLLDVKWATMARKLLLPPDRLRIYSPNELEAFLDFMERAKLAS